MPVSVNRPTQGGKPQPTSRRSGGGGKTEVSQPLAIVLVIVALVVIGAVGYFFMSRESKPTTETLQKFAPAASTAPTGGDAKGSTQQAGAQGGLTPNN